MADLPPDYLDYPHRHAGLDHDWFDRTYLKDAPPVQWPGGARIALMISVHLEHFPMDMDGVPFMPAGGMMRPYPSYWDYTSRDYGNRIGFFRIAKALDERGLTASAVMNAAVATRYPTLLDDVVSRDWEIVANGVDMGQLLHAGLSEAQERAIITRSLQNLRQASGQAVTGWASPAGAATLRTPALLVEQGVRYIGDWVNDDMPFSLRTAAGAATALPISADRHDKRIMVEMNQSEAAYERQIMAAFEVLDREAETQGGRIFSLPVTSWVSGQPFRIATLERILDRILADGAVWTARASDILAAWSDGTVPVTS